MHKAKWVCRYCIMKDGLRGSDLPNWLDEDDLEGIARHIESQHHIPVARLGETSKETMERFKCEYPEAGGPLCRCPKCVAARETAQHISRN